MFKDYILNLLAAAEMENEASEETLVTEDNTQENVEEQIEEKVEEETPTALSEIDLDGEKLTLDQIRELKKNNMAFSDYYEKYERLQALEREQSEAIELYKYLQSKPELVEQLYKQDQGLTERGVKIPTEYENRIQEVETKFRRMEIETALNSIKAKDSSVNELELLQTANNNKCSIETAYNIWKGENFDKLLETKLKEQSKSISKKIQQNADVTKTIINDGDGQEKNDGKFGLTDVEIAFARKIGLSAEEYSKWKN